MKAIGMSQRPLVAVRRVPRGVHNWVVATMTAKRAIFVRAATRERERCDDRIHRIDQSLTSRHRGGVRQLTLGLHDPAVGSPHTSPNTYEFASS